MLKTSLMMTIAAMMWATSIAAQVPNAADTTVGCETGQNRDRDECLLLPPVQEATNFIGLIAPVLLGAGAVGLIAAASSGGSTTPNTSN